MSRIERGTPRIALADPPVQSAHLTCSSVQVACVGADVHAGDGSGQRLCISSRRPLLCCASGGMSLATALAPQSSGACKDWGAHAQDNAELQLLTQTAVTHILIVHAEVST